ncbi:MAG: hypothetical protein LUP96_09420, partial [Methylococcaceae bacterium]|nr:hypothetical protein [Methylococcaceae bacterium]
TGFQPEHEPKLLRLTNYWQQHWPLWLLKHKYLLSVLMVIFIAGGLWQLTPRDDVRLLQSAPADLLKTADHIRQLYLSAKRISFFWCRVKISRLGIITNSNYWHSWTA